MEVLDIFNVIPWFNLIIIYVLSSKISNLSSPRINSKYPYLLKYVLGRSYQVYEVGKGAYSTH